MPLSSPLIFIHYGPARYLRWTLEAARRTNPEKRIILLGDQSNRHFTQGVAEFFFFEEFATGKPLQEFVRIFQVIQGERHRYTKEGGVEKWLQFVFRRWFLIDEFLKKEAIDSFWTFDSDTLLLESLDNVENRFRHVEATTQCRGKCLNAWVGSQSLVERYVCCINELFKDLLYLEQQRKRLLRDLTLSFNEMDAFEEFDRDGRKGKLLRKLGPNFPWGIVTSEIGNNYVKNLGPIPKVDGIDNLKVINVCPVGTTQWRIYFNCEPI
jgi:hypothetical protein